VPRPLPGEGWRPAGGWWHSQTRLLYWCRPSMWPRAVIFIGRRHRRRQRIKPPVNFTPSHHKILYTAAALRHLKKTTIERHEHIGAIGLRRSRLRSVPSRQAGWSTATAAASSVGQQCFTHRIKASETYPSHPHIPCSAKDHRWTIAVVISVLVRSSAAANPGHSAQKFHLRDKHT
jgi:hypothetical protein